MPDVAVEQRSHRDCRRGGRRTGAARRHAREPATERAGNCGSSSGERSQEMAAWARPISASPACLQLADQRRDNCRRTVQGGHVVLWRPAIWMINRVRDLNRMVAQLANEASRSTGLEIYPNDASPGCPIPKATRSNSGNPGTDPVESRASAWSRMPGFIEVGAYPQCPHRCLALFRSGRPDCLLIDTAQKCWQVLAAIALHRLAYSIENCRAECRPETGYDND